MTKKEIAYVKRFIAKSNKDYGWVDPTTGKKSPHTYIRVARPNSQIVKEYESTGFQEPLKAPLLYWGKTDVAYSTGSLVPMEKFYKILKWAKKQVDKPTTILKGTKEDTVHEIMRTVMRTQIGGYSMFFGNEGRRKAEMAHTKVVAGEMKKQEYQKEFLKNDPKATYKMLDELFGQDFTDRVSKTDWWRMNQKDKFQFMSENKIGTRKDGSAYYYGDSI